MSTSSGKNLSYPPGPQPLTAWLEPPGSGALERAVGGPVERSCSDTLTRPADHSNSGLAHAPSLEAIPHRAGPPRYAPTNLERYSLPGEHALLCDTRRAPAALSYLPGDPSSERTTILREIRIRPVAAHGTWSRTGPASPGKANRGTPLHPRSDYRKIGARGTVRLGGRPTDNGVDPLGAEVKTRRLASVAEVIADPFGTRASQRPLGRPNAPTR